MKILFTLINIAHVKTFLRLASQLKSIDNSVEIEVLSQDLYTNFSVAKLLQGKGWKVYNLPRNLFTGNYISDWFVLSDNFLIVKDFLAQFITSNKYQLVVMIQYDGGLFEQLIFEQCKHANVPSVLLQEGLIMLDNDIDENTLTVKKSNKPSFTKKLRKVHQLLFAHHSISGYFAMKKYVKKNPLRGFGFNGSKYIAALSPYYADKLILKGFPEERVCPVGLSRFDEINEIIEQHGGIAWEQFDSPSQIKVLFPQSWGLQFGKRRSNFYEEIEYVLTTARLLRQKDIRYSLTYRIREGENLNEYPAELFHQMDFFIEDGSVVDSYHSIINHNIIISKYSTMLLEAMKFKKYCIVFDPLSEDLYGYVRDGGCLSVTNTTELVTAIERISSDALLRDTMRKKAELFTMKRAMMDGKATERTANFLYNIFQQENAML